MLTLLSLGDGQHWPAKIRTEDLCCRTFREFYCEIAGPTGNVQNNCILSIEDISKLISDQSPPALVYIQREQVIEQIVSASYARKHLPNGFGVGRLFCGSVR
jgi:hypothetical protein